MNEEELLAFLKENLSIHVSTIRYQDFGSEGVKVNVALWLDGELISEEYDTFSIES